MSKAAVYFSFSCCRCIRDHFSRNHSSRDRVKAHSLAAPFSAKTRCEEPLKLGNAVVCTSMLGMLWHAVHAGRLLTPLVASAGPACGEFAPLATRMLPCARRVFL